MRNPPTPNFCPLQSSLPGYRPEWLVNMLFQDSNIGHFHVEFGVCFLCIKPPEMTSAPPHPPTKKVCPLHYLAWLRYLKIAIMETFHIWFIDLQCLEEELFCFWWRSKVIWGHQRSNIIHLWSSEVKKQNFPRIPKIDILIGVTIDKKASVPKIFI